MHRLEYSRVHGVDHVFALALRSPARRAPASRGRVSPGATVAGVAQDARAVGVPADRVAAAEHRERAERLEPAGARCRAARRRGAAAARPRAASRPSAADQPRRGCAPSRRPRSNVVELAPQLLTAGARARRAARASTRASACVSSAACRPRIASARRKAGERRPAAGDVHAAAQALHAPARRGDAAARAGDRSGRRIRPSRATTSSAAADGVGARTSATKSAIVTSVSWPTAEMTGTGDARDRARDDLLVERPEILDRSAAAADDDDVDAGHACDRRAAPRAISRRRALALHARRADHEVRVRVAPPQHLDDVADRRAVERRDDADLARQRRQRPLARRVEQPFGLQPLLQLIERELQRAETVRLEVLADELVFALRLVDARRVPRATTRRPSAGLNFR